MKANPSKPLSAVAVALVLISNNASAVDAVIDAAHMGETIAGFAQSHTDSGLQLTELGKQLTELKNTYTQVKNTYDGLTGNRGFGGVQTLTNAVRNYLPQNVTDLANVVNGGNGTYGNMGAQVKAYTQQNAILSPGAIANLKMNANQLNLFNQQRNNTAAIQATAAQSMDAASQRFNYIQQLMNQVNTTKDPKGIAELQARIAGEQVMLQNDQTKMQQMYAYLQNQERVGEQQKRELAIQQVGHTKDLTQPNYSTNTNK